MGRDRKKYPNQWVGLSEVEWEGYAPNVRSAVVKYAGNSGDIQRKIIAGEDIHLGCTISDDTYPFGFQVSTLRVLSTSG